VNRYEELDSLRGFAALAVVISHAITMTVKMPWEINIFPLRILWAANEAVVFFFVLSGFVLFLPYSRSEGPDNMSFLIKRIFRIYVPYLVAITLSFLGCFLFSKGSITSLGPWLASKWAVPITDQVLLQHVTLLSNFQTTHFNPAIWSLIHEMRVSLFFPFIALMVLNLPYKFNIFVAVVLSLISAANNVFGYELSVGMRTGFIDTLHFTSMFIFGALLANNRHKLTSWFNGVALSHKYAIGILAFTLYVYSRGLEMLSSKKSMVVFSDWGAMIGACMIIVLALSVKGFSQILKSKFFIFHGNISYSLYLFHTVALFTIFHAFYGKLSILVLYLLSVILIYLLSTCSYYFVEKPSIRLGKKVILHWQNRGHERPEISNS
jgi:peptidoglycan/LPS O-acetylase OafA/YrhL